MVGRRARTRAPWWRAAPGARLRGRVRTRRPAPTRGRRPCRCGFNRRVLASADNDVALPFDGPRKACYLQRELADRQPKQMISMFSKQLKRVKKPTARSG